MEILWSWSLTGKCSRRFEHNLYISGVSVNYQIQWRVVASSRLSHKSVCSGRQQSKHADPKLFMPLVENPCLPRKVVKLFRCGVPEEYVGVQEDIDQGESDNESLYKNEIKCWHSECFKCKSCQFVNYAYCSHHWNKVIQVRSNTEYQCLRLCFQRDYDSGTMRVNAVRIFFSRLTGARHCPAGFMIWYEYTFVIFSYTHSVRTLVIVMHYIPQYRWYLFWNVEEFPFNRHQFYSKTLSND